MSITYFLTIFNITLMRPEFTTISYLFIYLFHFHTLFYTFCFLITSIANYSIWDLTFFPLLLDLGLSLTLTPYDELTWQNSSSLNAEIFYFIIELSFHNGHNSTLFLICFKGSPSSLYMRHQIFCVYMGPFTSKLCLPIHN